MTKTNKPYDITPRLHPSIQGLYRRSQVYLNFQEHRCVTAKLLSELKCNEQKKSCKARIQQLRCFVARWKLLNSQQKSCKVCQVWHDPLPHVIKCQVLPYLPLPPYGLMSFMDSPLSNMTNKVWLGMLGTLLFSFNLCTTFDAGACPCCGIFCYILNL